MLPRIRHRVGRTLLLYLTVIVAVPAGSLAAQPIQFRPWLPMPASLSRDVPLALTPAQWQDMTKNGELTSFAAGAAPPVFSPSYDLGGSLRDYAGDSPATITIEALMIRPLPDGLKEKSDLRLFLYNLLHGFSTMKGIEYWSASRSQMRIFFESSAIVRGPADRRPLTDPKYAAIDPVHRLYVEQTDSSFGKNLYIIDIKAWDDGGISLTMTNLEQVWYGIVPVMSPGGISMTVYVKNVADYLVFYGYTGIQAPDIFGIADRVKQSFYNRMVALFDWYGKRLETEAGLLPGS